MSTAPVLADEATEFADRSVVGFDALDDELMYRAVQGRDHRFDGWFVIAVRTTGIYCRPSCPATTPRRSNVTFHPTAAAAQQLGYRACKRCRPDASPGSPAWNARADAVARAMRLIADGVIDREGVGGVAARVGYSERHLNRIVTTELGAGPLAIARAQRAQTARLLVETTDMPMIDVAFAAGFASVRQFNETMRDVFATAPSDLRAAARRAAGAAAHRRRAPQPPQDATSPATGSISLRLPVRGPFAAVPLFEFLALRAIPGVEAVERSTSSISRSLRLPHGHGTARLTFSGEAAAVGCELWLADLADLQAAVQRCRRWLDLDADPVTIDAHLAADPVLAPLVTRTPGLRSPGAVDATEMIVRGIVGQQVSVAGARTVLGRIASMLDDRVASGAPASLGVDLVFPTAEQLAALDPADLPMPRARGRAIVGVGEAIASGAVAIDVGADRRTVTADLQRLAGIGPWTASYVAMRALGDPDVFLATDLGVRHAAESLGLPTAARALDAVAERWRPWRSYALHHLWHHLSAPTQEPS
jgi:AraC family transcriptional regulator, regulatory protein of adaptative response / DNA-3-methyladenine glycosylase II